MHTVARSEIFLGQTFLKVVFEKMPLGHSLVVTYHGGQAEELFDPHTVPHLVLLVLEDRKLMLVGMLIVVADQQELFASSLTGRKRLDAPVHERSVEAEVLLVEQNVLVRFKGRYKHEVVCKKFKPSFPSQLLLEVWRHKISFLCEYGVSHKEVTKVVISDLKDALVNPWHASY